MMCLSYIYIYKRKETWLACTLATVTPEATLRSHVWVRVRKITNLKLFNCGFLTHSLI